jgi:hypothetical protein
VLILLNKNYKKEGKQKKYGGEKGKNHKSCTFLSKSPQNLENKREQFLHFHQIIHRQ